MELLRISDSKLKVMLTGADMRKYRLDAGKMDYESAETRRAFWTIFDEAKERTGFDTSCDKVLIQLYPAKDGGCEIFVTKLGLNPPLSARAAAREKRTMLPAMCSVFRFRDFSSLLTAARLFGKSDGAHSELYCAPDGRFDLILEESRPAPGKLASSARLAEFSDRLSLDMADYVREHDRRIFAEDAVSRLAAL